MRSITNTLHSPGFEDEKGEFISTYVAYRLNDVHPIPFITFSVIDPKRKIDLSNVCYYPFIIPDFSVKYGWKKRPSSETLGVKKRLEIVKFALETSYDVKLSQEELEDLFDIEK